MPSSKCFHHSHPMVAKVCTPCLAETNIYGAKMQYAPYPDNMPMLCTANHRHVQEVIGMLLYYSWAVDSTPFTALGSIATQQAKGTYAAIKGITAQILKYCACQMLLSTIPLVHIVSWMHNDTLYLSAPKGQSCRARYCFLWPGYPQRKTQHYWIIVS